MSSCSRSASSWFDIVLYNKQSSANSEAVKSEANLGARHFEIERITAD